MDTNKRSDVDPVMIAKYIGCTVNIIYLSRTGKITQRRIQVWSVRGGIVKAFCLEQQGPRIFRLEKHPGLSAGEEIGMSKTFSVEPCTCKALMRPRWSRDEPRVFVCMRCGRPVPGYEELWIQRERVKGRDHDQKARR